MGVFHAYDIRGVYGEELDEGVLYLIGRAVVAHTGAARVLVGRDMRTSSVSLRDALVRGITDQGADVVDIGLCSTPMFYWATREFPAGVMVTASHNPAQYNGCKICRDGAVPVGEASGLREIEALVLSQELPDADRKGSSEEQDVLDAFVEWNLMALKTDAPFRIVVDAANGMGGLTYARLRDRAPTSLTIIPMFFELDGTFPNHEANPLKTETLVQLQERVRAENAHLGVALDGDGDRVAFVDERGEPIASDLTTALIARQVLQERPGSTILYDIRSSRVCPEEIEAAGGKAVMTRVGHAFIKLAMREYAAAFGGEISGHYYNAEQQNAENTQVVLFRLLNLLAHEGKQLSAVVAPLRRYAKSPETNFTVADKVAAIARVEQTYAAGASSVSRIDGVRVDYPDWWCSVRASNTEPLLRLNLEARTPELLAAKLAEISTLIL